jgi:transcriptional regulator with XRE-family HTH domain
MNIGSIGRVIAAHRRARGLTLRELATAARVGRSTLAAVESGTLQEIGVAKIDRICTALGLTLEIREPVLEAPLMEHRHLTERAGRALTRAAIADVITRGEIDAWRGLVKAIRADTTGRIARRAREVARALSAHDTRARAFAALLPVVERDARDGHDART